ncbi:hypothetical protein FRB90_006739 [Tulasnella sp. 427]|nr:hypothetical protein FRB90_006739 [Tulasnella sp. 427]
MAPRGRARTSRAIKNVSDENKHLESVPQGSGSHSLATPPVLGDQPNVSVWDPDAGIMYEPNWAAIDEWNNPGGDITWQWEADRDSSIALDDPNREKKLAWRMENGHVYSSGHRVKRWKEALPDGTLLFRSPEEIESYGQMPPREELWDGRKGCKLNRDRSRSPSRGRQGKRSRAVKAEEWRDKLEGMLSGQGDQLHNFDPAPGTFSQGIQDWFDELVKKPKWSYLQKAKAKAFFELPYCDKVWKVEGLIMEIAEQRKWYPHS